MADTITADEFMQGTPEGAISADEFMRGEPVTMSPAAQGDSIAPPAAWKQFSPPDIQTVPNAPPPQSGSPFMKEWSRRIVADQLSQEGQPMFHPAGGFRASNAREMEREALRFPDYRQIAPDAGKVVASESRNYITEGIPNILRGSPFEHVGNLWRETADKYTPEANTKTSGEHPLVESAARLGTALVPMIAGGYAAGGAAEVGGLSAATKGIVGLAADMLPASAGMAAQAALTGGSPYEAALYGAGFHALGMVTPAGPAPWVAKNALAGSVIYQQTHDPVQALLPIAGDMAHSVFRVARGVLDTKPELARKLIDKGTMSRGEARAAGLPAGIVDTAPKREGFVDVMRALKDAPTEPTEARGLTQPPESASDTTPFIPGRAGQPAEVTVSAGKSPEVPVSETPAAAGAETGQLTKETQNAVQEQKPSESVLGDQGVRGQGQLPGVGQQNELQSPPQTGTQEGPAAGTVGQPPDVVSLQNASVAELRQRMNLPPQGGVDPVTWEQRKADAIRQGIPDRALEIATDSVTKGTMLDATQQMGILIRTREIANQHTALDTQRKASADPVEQDALAGAMRNLEGEAGTLTDATRSQGGTAVGQALQMRQAAMTPSYDLLSLTLDAKAAKGAPLTEAERAGHARDAELIAAKDAENAALKKQIRAMEPQWLQRLTKSNEARRQRIREKLGGSTLRAGLDPEILKDLAFIGAEHVARGAKKIGDFATALKEDLGDLYEKVKDNIGEIHTAALAAARERRRGKATPEDTATLVQEREQLVAVTKKDVRDSIAEKAKEGGSPLTMGREIQRLAKEFVESGIKKRNELIDAVHGELQKIFPEVSKRETAEAITQYGVYKELSKDQTDVTLRDLKGQIRQDLKLEDMAAGRPPPKSGIEHPVPSTEERLLQQQVEQAKKKGGYVVTDPERQLKTALGAVKTRLRNQISDYEKQIETRTRLVKDKSQIARDPEAKALELKRDMLKAAYDAVFGTRQLTDAQRIATATKAVQDSIADLTLRIQRGDLAPRKPGTTTPETPALKALRERRDALTKQLGDLRRASDAYKQNLIDKKIDATNKRIAVLDQHIKAGTLPPEPAPRKPEATNANLDALREQKKQLEDQLKNSDPAVQARLKEQIARVTEQLLKPPEAPVPKPDNWLKMSEKARRMDYELAVLKSNARHRIEALRPKTVWGIGGDAVGVWQAWKSGFDQSGLGRQGGILIFQPKVAARAISDMVQATLSKQRDYEIDRRIRNDPDTPFAVKSGLYLAPFDLDTAKWTQMEETQSSHWIKHIPMLAASERAFRTVKNSIGLNTFKAFVHGFSPGGVGEMEKAKVLSNHINISLGRGNVGEGQLANAAAALNKVWWAPRFVLSRFQYALGPAFLWHGPWEAKKVVARLYAQHLVGMAAAFGLASLAGARVNMDPNDPDFGIHYGRLHINPLSGLSQVTLFMKRMGAAAYAQRFGTVSEAADKGREANNALFNFVLRKSAPLPNTMYQIVTGKDVMQQPVTMKGIAYDITVPMTLDDIGKSLMAEQGAPADITAAMLAWIGVGVQVYDKKSRSSGSSTPPKPPSFKVPKKKSGFHP